MIRRPPSTPRTDSPFPHTTLFLSLSHSSYGARIPNVLSQSDVLPLPHFARPLRTRNPADQLCTQAGRRAGAVFARFHFALRSRCRSAVRSEAHTSELQSLMRISYTVFCLKIKKHHDLLKITT